jgi:hypothetical protein
MVISAFAKEMRTKNTWGNLGRQDNDVKHTRIAFVDLAPVLNSKHYHSCIVWPCQ